MRNFDLSLPEVLRYEGGFTKDVHDRGNWTGGAIGKGELKGTKLGVSAAAYPNLDIARLTPADVAPIYKRDYWDKVRGDDLPAGADHAVFDAAVNSGVSRASKWLQQALQVAVDGVIGSRTITMANGYRAGGAALVRAVCAKRTTFLHGLSNWVRYGKGWAARIAAVEAFGVKLALQAAGASAHEINVDAAQQSAEAKKSAASNRTGAIVTTAAAGGDAAQVDPTPAAHAISNGAVIVAFVILAVVVIWFVWRVHIQAARAAAYSLKEQSA
jgi:lysozyme family protein